MKVASTVEQRVALVELVWELVRAVPSLKVLMGHCELGAQKSDPYERWLPGWLRRWFGLRALEFD